MSTACSMTEGEKEYVGYYGKARTKETTRKT
jgi:hypothetical protein